MSTAANSRLCRGIWPTIVFLTSGAAGRISGGTLMADGGKLPRCAGFLERKERTDASPAR